MRSAIAGVLGLGLRLAELGIAGLVTSNGAFAPLLYLVPLAGAVIALFVLKPPVRRTQAAPPEIVAGGA